MCKFENVLLKQNIILKFSNLHILKLEEYLSRAKSILPMHAGAK